MTKVLRPKQQLHVSAGDCALYRESRVGSLYSSFGVASRDINGTMGYECSCYDATVDALRLVGSGATTFYDYGCFLIEC